MTDIHEDAMSILYGTNDVYAQYYENLPTETLAKMNSLWEELKVECSSGYGVYIASGVIVAALVLMLGVSAYRKKKRAKYYD